MAVASLVLGLFSFFCTILTGIPAIILGCLSLSGINKSRGALTGSGLAIAGIVTGGLGCALLLVSVGLLLPAVNAAREAARRTQCANNMRNIGLAMLQYSTAKNKFPASTVDPTGKPLLSWRVLLLPYLDEQDLYNRFKLDEPWDSPNNKPLLAYMPSVYKCPSAPESEQNSGQTFFQVLLGPGTLFEQGKPVTPAGVYDGLSNTLMVVETKVATPWTQPSGLDFIPNSPIQGLGSGHAGGFNAAFADGAVRFLKDSIPARTLEALVTRNGHETVDVDALW
jgi:prepilin-type processing-associated H-X9-DG protein